MLHEYCCSVIKLGELEPVPGADRLVKATINGDPVLLGKGIYNEGDIMIYCPIETQLSYEFLRDNNLFGMSDYELNKDSQKIKSLLESGNPEEAKKYCGFFDTRRRVRILRLRGNLSMGFLFGVDALVRWKPALKGVNLEMYLGEEFDTVLGDLLINVYIPKTNKKDPKKTRGKGKERKFDNLVVGVLKKHYETNELKKNLQYIKADDKVTITTKLHGTSIILSNTLCKVTLRVGWKIKPLRDLANWLICRFPKLGRTVNKYVLLYSSRNNIRNTFTGIGGEDITPEDSIYGEWYKIMKPYIPEGRTIYGEVVGFTEKGEKIQPDYDYGCAPGKSKLMIYRVSDKTEAGESFEWDVCEIQDLTKKMMQDNPELQDKLLPIEILYHGTFQDLYPEEFRSPDDIELKENIYTLLEDEKRFGMNELEPGCVNKVPREGIVIRKDGDPVPEAFKVKGHTFFEWEAKKVDKGETGLEMSDGA